MKKNAFFGLLVLVLIFIFLGCEEDLPIIYTVNIGTLINANGSTITADPTSGVEGTEITLTVTPTIGYKLKAGTLRYGTTSINETTLTFNLPAENITITAEFELIEYITVTKDITVNFPDTFFSGTKIIDFTPEFIPKNGWGDHFSESDIIYNLICTELSLNYDNTTGFIVNINDSTFLNSTTYTFNQIFIMNENIIYDQIINVRVLLGSFALLRDVNNEVLDPLIIPSVKFTISKTLIK